MMYLIEHDGDLTDLGESWTLWRRTLREPARLLYEALISPELAEVNTPITDRLLMARAGLSSRNALSVNLTALETEHFVALFVDDDSKDVVQVTVGLPPVLTNAQEAAMDTIGADRSLDDAAKARRITQKWQQGFEKLLGEPYTITTKDKMQALRLVKNEPFFDPILAIIAWYWRYGYDKERMSLAYFCSRFSEFAERKAMFERNLH